MINQEEYEMLKDLDDSLRWIVRSRYGWLFATRTAPIKIGLNWEYGGIGAHLFTDKESEMLGFIKWTDDKPYEIAELIEEYEYSADYYANQFAKLSEVIHGSKSEEKEVKDLEWLKEEINKINPFVQLTWTWQKIASIHKHDSMYWEYAKEDFMKGRDGIVVEKPEIPQFVGDWFEDNSNLNLNGIFDKLNNKRWEDGTKEVFDWTFDYSVVHGDGTFGNLKTLALAGLYGYTIEAEPKYYVMNNDNRMMLVKKMDGKTITEADPFKIEDMYENEREAHQLTEQEIKEYDERYWAFRKPAEELGE